VSPSEPLDIERSPYRPVERRVLGEFRSGRKFGAVHPIRKGAMAGCPPGRKRDRILKVGCGPDDSDSRFRSGFPVTKLDLEDGLIHLASGGVQSTGFRGSRVRATGWWRASVAELELLR